MSSNTNLYVLSRAETAQKQFCEVMIQRELKQFREYEYDMLRELVDSLIMYGAEVGDLDGFTYSFSVPYISCEIDLLKIDKSRNAIDIELKSQMVSEGEIANQMKRLRHYLETVADEVYSFTVVKDSNRLVLYSFDGEQLQEVHLRDLIRVLRVIKSSFCNHYEELFRPSDYLISPINSPDKFLAERYILTTQQEEIKKKVVSNFFTEPSSVLGITGNAGTGKTLLLYDIAIECSRNFRVCIVHCGKNAEGHEYLNEHCENVFFPYIGCLWRYREHFEESEFIFVDEAHRLHSDTFLELCRLAEHARGVLLSYDPIQVLSKKEEMFNASDRIQKMLTHPSYKLTNKIRTNPEVASFIDHVFHLHRFSGKYDYSCITILYAGNLHEAKRIIKFYAEKLQYKFINYTPSNKIKSMWDEFREYQCAHEVIGQEFDNVLVLMDDNFQYANGSIVCKEHPNPDYLYGKLLYQAMSRTRIRLAILVLDNKKMFEELLRIKNLSNDMRNKDVQ